MGLEFSPQGEKRFKEIVGRYPNTRAALLPVLYVAQDEFGYLSVEAMDYVADRLELPASKVLSVATFYTMYNKRPIGKYHVQVCVSISCALLGAHRLIHDLEKRLGIKVGETSEDGLFTLTEVECLASCGTAPMLQINEDYHEDLGTKEAVDAVFEPLLAERSTN